MSLPTRDNLFGLDFSYLGEPFVFVATKPETSTEGLDYSYLGEPFLAIAPPSPYVQIIVQIGPLVFQT